MRSSPLSVRARAALLYLLLGMLLLLCAFPLLWMASYSLRPTDLPPANYLELFAPPYAFDNYAAALRLLPLGQYAWNSLKVAALAVPLTVLTASWAGFVIAQVSRRWRLALLALSVAAMLVPSPSLWVPRFLIFSQLGWIDTLAPLIAPALMGTSPFYVIMFYLAFARLPRDLWESARLDGAQPVRVWFSLALPLVRPTFIAVVLLSFAFYWSNYVDPLLYLRSETNFTLPIGIHLLGQIVRANWPLLMAGSMLMVAPIVLVLLLAQRWFLQGQITLARRQP